MITVTVINRVRTYLGTAVHTVHSNLGIAQDRSRISEGVKFVEDPDRKTRINA
jgi:hypothetical protein